MHKYSSLCLLLLVFTAACPSSRKVQVLVKIFLISAQKTYVVGTH